MFEITLPWPDSKLSPNVRTHWGAKSKVFAQHKMLAGLQTHIDTNNATISKKIAIEVSIHFYPPDKRKRDVDNLLASIKAYLDGIAQALDVNDSQFNPITVKREEPRADGCVKFYLGRYW